MLLWITALLKIMWTDCASAQGKS